MSLKEKMERQIFRSYVNALYFTGLGGLMLILYSARWELWVAEISLAVITVLHLNDARKGKAILRNPLFYLVAIEHDLRSMTREVSNG